MALDYGLSVLVDMGKMVVKYYYVDSAVIHTLFNNSLALIGLAVWVVTGLSAARL